MERISFENIHLVFGGGGTAEDAARRDLPEIAGEYFMLGPMPAYGLYARHAHALTLSNVRLETATPDLRPAVILDHVHDASIDGLAAQADANAESALRFIDTRDVLITAPRLLSPAKTFLQVEGSESNDILVQGGDLRRATKPFAFANGAAQNALQAEGVGGRT